MVNSCCSYGCTNVYNSSSDVRFHLFPHAEPDKLVKWIHALRRKNFKPSKTTTICSENFLESDYVENVNTASYRKVLKKMTIPSKFNFPSHLQPKVPNRRVLVRNIADGIMDNSSPVSCTKEFIVSSAHCIDMELSQLVLVMKLMKLKKLQQENKKLRREEKILQQRLKRKDPY